ncbi:replication protein [Bacillus cereus]|nr:replication protein [Bacillus cereus]PGU63177.1 replication protein [Bacillus cereus]
MNFQHEVFDIIATFSGQANKIVINTSFVDFVDDLEIGLFLSQLIYWSDRTTRADGYFYKTDKEWHEETRISKYAVRKSRKKLEDMGLLNTFVKKANGSPTVHYKLNKKRFSEMFISFLRNQKNEILKPQNPSFETETSLTDITTDITTENVSSSSIFSFYENNFGILNSFIAESISQWVNDTSEELVQAAMERALKHQKKWNYAEGILKQWVNKNIRTLTDVNAAETEFKNKGKKGEKNNASVRKNSSFIEKYDFE